MAKAREIGCIACVKVGRIIPFEVPIEYTAIHHIEGKTKEDAHFLTIPLCPGCHQQNPDAVHRDRTQFEENYGTEYDLLDYTREILGI